jgi:integrase
VGLIRAKLQLETRTRDLALFNLAIDSKPRGCDLVALRADDVAPNGCAVDRATVRQRKTGRPVRFELTEITREALDDYLRVSRRQAGQWLFPGRRGPAQHLTTRQYARLVSEWLSGIGLDPLKYATHSMRRTRATLIYRRTGNLIDFDAQEAQLSVAGPPCFCHARYALWPRCVLSRTSCLTWDIRDSGRSACAAAH